MFDSMLTKLFPAAMMGGLALYLLATILWLQPLVESRMADKYLIPFCETELETSENTSPVRVDPRRGELEMLIRMLEDSGLAGLPMIRSQIEMARSQLRAMSPSRLRITSVERSSTCSCAADKAFEEVHFPTMTMHVASARTYTPAAVKSLEQSTRAIAFTGQCGTLPWMEG